MDCHIAFACPYSFCLQFLIHANFSSLEFWSEMADLPWGVYWMLSKAQLRSKKGRKFRSEQLLPGTVFWRCSNSFFIMTLVGLIAFCDLDFSLCSNEMRGLSITLDLAYLIPRSLNMHRTWQHLQVVSIRYIRAFNFATTCIIK